MQIDRMNVEWKFLYVVYQNACFFNFRDEARIQEPQNFVEVLNIDDVTGNDIIQRNQHRKENKIKLSSALITGVKLAS